MTRTANAVPDPSPPEYPAWLLLPASLWMACLLVAPLLVVLLVSFASRGTYGGVVWHWTLANYLELLHPVYITIFVTSLGYASLTTVLCLVIGFPFAYFIARAPRHRQSLWLVLVLIPFWTNFLVRTYAWMFLLRAEGLINTGLLGLGVVEQPVQFLYRPATVVMGLVYGYLPFMILPLYLACERMDPQLIQAARDLYAGGWAIARRIVWPLAKPGIVAGCLLVFIPSVGAFLTPDLLGGARTMMIGNLIQHEYLVVRDWPLGSALAFVLMLLVLAVLKAYYRAAARMDSSQATR